MVLPKHILSVFLSICAVLAYAVSTAAEDPAKPSASTVDTAPSEAIAALPFPPGEKLTYEIRWSIFPVGTATLEFQGPVDFHGQESYRIVLTAATNSFADKFFKVRNLNVSWVDADFSKPIYYIKNQNEGKEHREVIVTFDWENKKAQYSNFGEKRDPIDIVDGSWDPLSIVYAVRAMEFAQMQEISIPTTDGKKTMTTEITIRNRETIKVPAGRFDTIVVEPDTKDLGGVFEKSDDAGMRFWFSNDDRRFPVRMSSSVAVGSFVAELVSVEGPGAEAYQQQEKESFQIRRGKGR